MMQVKFLSSFYFAFSIFIQLRHFLERDSIEKEFPIIMLKENVESKRDPSAD